MNRILFILLTVSFGASCSVGIGNIEKGYALKQYKGVVVFSFTSSGQCGYALFVDIRSSTGDFDKSIGMQDMFEKRDWEKENGPCSKDANDFSGKLKSIALNEGIYEIYRLSGISDHHSFSSEDDFSIKFKVTGNSITYLGNAHFFVGDRTYNFSISDKRERDILLFEEKYPEIQSDYIINILEEAIFHSA